MLQADSSTEIVFASEIDKYAKQIYRKNFGVEPHGDITKINAADVPDHDILCGGFPCQDVSIAGKREGLCGARSGLFYEIIRILREKQPELVFLENVKGLLSSDSGWDFARILIELENAGYLCEWEVLNTRAWLPQNRERVYLIGLLAESRRSGRKVFPIEKSGGMVDKKEPAVYTIDANYYKGPAKQSRTMILCDSCQGRKTQLRDETIAPLRANTGAGYNNVVCHSTLPRNSKSGKGGTGRLQGDDGVPSCCDAANNIAVELNQQIRRLTPTECERLQGFPSEWTAGGIDESGNLIQISDTQRYKSLGNAVSVPVIEYIFKSILDVIYDD